MLPIVPKGAAGAADDGAVDFLAGIRRRRQQLAKASTRLFELPCYGEDNPEMGGALVARYRRLGVEELNAALIVRTDEADIVARNAQFLADACEDILFRPKGGTTLHPLVPGHTTTFKVNLTSGVSLATFTGDDGLPSLRDQMVAVFGENEHTLGAHSDEVWRWMVAENRGDAETALGET